MQATDQDINHPKLLRTCSLPLTGQQVVNRVIPNSGFLDGTPEGSSFKNSPPV